MILNEIVSDRIKEQITILEDKGEILPIEQLSGYYRLFRQKFGTETLASMDGETLLSIMHDTRNRDSLVYWLEFKNDDEMPNRFGSIAGGSGLKFGIYRRGENGKWMTGAPQNQIILTQDEAIQIARNHRDQLQAGVKLLEALPENASNEEYAKLQADMDKIAPDVSNTAWGHKYFSMMFPTKLEDFHSPHYQRFHLMKMLQTPIAKDGRYSVSGQYISIAHELNIHINNLTRVLNSMDGSPYRYWSIKVNITVSKGPEWHNWEEMRDGGFIGIGWREVGDLSGLTYDVESRGKLKALMLEKYNEKGGFAQGVFNFVQAIKPGDIVLATEKQGKVLGIGRVIGGYYFDNQSRVSHRINVEWLSQDSWNLPNDEVRNQVIREMTSPDNLVETETRIIGLSPIIKTNPPEKPIITLSGIPVRINEILERKRQVILYGPPGTGKTHWAYQSAINIASINNYKIEFSGLSEEQKKTLLGNEKHQGLIRMCTFHPSYGYEDFIEGYRPKSNNGILIFELHSGIFKQLCIDARQQTNQKFFLIIDEINRGDIPRIFGELLTILEKDKRGREIILPVSGDNFSVPDNVYIIGTMNTADRSIALLDTALRRRFGFIELMPDSSILGNIVLQSIPLASWLDALNNRILKSIGRDSRNLQIGHAYLLENGHPLTDFTRFTRVLQDDIIPLLEEYCYEDYDALEKILGKGLVDREKQKINHELFEPSHRDDLIQALLEPSPEITTTSAAVQQDQTEIIEEEETEDQT